MVAVLSEGDPLLQAEERGESLLRGPKMVGRLSLLRYTKVADVLTKFIEPVG